jgi:hypothetical protein
LTTNTEWQGWIVPGKITFSFSPSFTKIATSDSMGLNLAKII